MGSSVLTSSYEAASSDGEINDSRFNDISCISYADRTIDEKDTVSRIDMSKESINTSRCSANQASNETKQSANSSNSFND
mmetsp:Transcript_8103/g.9686  ORF Transcript_8103/g.9686 Transcript_8103/m.9686 type:complete len:80 (-) Transcript_8103:1708-1947(-)